ncbi:N-acetyltransferase [Limosilactobacillus fermentum]|uniref:GNAT family N-acetyltransferase n=1 Tax=Limosilactobacillus fermentum TaxID=1613 RepID=UPI0021E93748|nr:GNAT family N-acetyltransferase [Limosilactobacillus fermentum]MCV3754740.1 N-acetyltransferase [Limosilactobacillus fermentum]
MHYKYEKNVLTVTKDQSEYVGELDYPAIPDYDNRYAIERVFVASTYRGTGVASDLVKTFVEHAKEEGWVLKLMCPYAVAQFKRHPEYQKVLLPEDRFPTTFTD